MDRRIRYTAGLVTIVGLAACGRPAATVSDDMQRDLDLAGTSAVELAPRASRTQIVSAIELGKPAAKPSTPTAAPVRQTRAPQAQPTRTAPTVPQQVAAAPEPEPQPVAETPAPVAETPAPAPATTVDRAPASAPLPMPQRAPNRGRGRNGGWWSTGDVIRNAPFPINP